ncbi:ankyrin repeat domain-containing protein 28 [Coprinopsis cinerea okayama7|uniref:Ankyrin repeat domain-containing protein 28 n=1 Tax=Coprinopsis cinerea (strain Okayama-7 / 130 / ATCC MYA-4618 / FGSC 9003) TaxID=240176 RepID=A8NAH8_COPC7|nr:ankyrin repeat domain-containing protein 28 [Coprinopsis cinerea okayama7\|eukprot:XP_001831830.1 ankyrin repeat domain-containing protein 28 [Coprinopsis cinerea okayama7\
MALMVDVLHSLVVAQLMYFQAESSGEQHFGTTAGFNTRGGRREQRLLNRLAHRVNFRAIQLDVRKKWTPGTGAWFLQSRLYKEWKGSRSGVLWGTGIPGAGKTLLASNVANDLLQLEEEAKGRVAVIVIYCRYTESLSVKEILEATLKQYLERHPFLVDLIEPLYARHDREKTTPTEEELVDLLRFIESQFERCYYVIDGVDEANVTTQFDLIDTLNQLQGNFFLCSRPLDSLSSELVGSVFFEVSAQMQDLELLVCEKLKRNSVLSHLAKDHEFLQRLVKQIAEKAGGMFLHAALQANLIPECVTLQSLQERLDQFPTELEDMYRAALERIERQPPQAVTLAKHVLLWLVYGEEALSMSDLRHAVSASGGISLGEETGPLEMESFKSALSSLFCGLVVVDTATNLVRLVHFTAKDALAPLLIRHFPNPHYTLFKVAADRLIAHNVTNEADLATQQDLDRLLAGSPVLRYSYDHWASHARQCTSAPEASESVLRFIEQCTHYPCNLDPDPDYDDKLDFLLPIHVVARFGIPILDKLIATTSVDRNQATAGEFGATPVMLAAGYGHLDILKQLLAVKRRKLVGAFIRGHSSPGVHLFKGVDINAKDCGGRTALMYAVESGQVEVVRELLKAKGLQVNQADSDGMTALMYASQEAYSEIVQLLLAVGGIQVNQVDSDGMTALMYASKARRGDAVVTLLLRTEGIKTNQADHYGRTVLMFASEGGREPVVEMLLRAKDVPDSNQADETGCTAVMMAAMAGSEIIFHLLVGRDGIQDINQSDNEGRTLLMHAARGGNEVIFQMLLQCEGVHDVNKADNRGQTVLMHASVGGNEAIVQLLLQTKGIHDINQVDSDGKTSLIHAAFHGNEDVTTRLLRIEGIHPNHADNDGMTALMYTALRGKEGVAKVLLRFDGIHDPNLASNDGKTALMHSTTWHAVLAFLLQVEGINVTQVDNEGMTALMHAAAHGSEASVRTLLQAGGMDSLNLTDNDGRTALMHASHWGNEDVVRFLLQLEEIHHINKADHYGQTALIFAAEGSGAEAIPLLLRVEGVEVNATDNDGRNALMAAAGSGNEDAIRLLLQVEGIPVNQRDNDGCTALMLAAGSMELDGESTAVVRRLLRVPGIQVDLVDNEGSQALMYALNEGNLDAAELILKALRIPLLPTALRLLISAYGLVADDSDSD